MRDVDQGRILLILSVLAMIAYLWAIFLAPDDAVFLGKSIGQWALIIPVLLFVLLFLFVVAWIGWAMATTQPPLPLKDKDGSQEK